MDARYKKRKKELLDECKVDPEVFKEVMGRLARFMDPFLQSLCRKQQCEHARTYMSGLLSDLKDKNVESIAYRFDQDRLPLQRFIGCANWDDAPLRLELARQVGQQLGEPDGVIVFDPSGFPKSGSESVGVARQWCGRLGKVENCQVAVYLGYVSHREHTLVDMRLYLPKEWTQDKARCEKAGVPKERRRHRTRHRQCLEMLEDKGHLLPHSWIAGDDEMGRAYWFRQRLCKLKERYLLAVPSNTLIRDLDVDRPAYKGRGPYPERPWQRVDKWTMWLEPSAWTQIDVRDGAKEPLLIEAVKRPVVARTPKRQEGHDEVLIVIRYRDRDDNKVVKTDYYLSNALDETPLGEFARVAKAEQRIEECIQRGKSEAGLADYEVRTWKGWHHHQTLSLIATWFLVAETRRGKKMDTGDHASADSGRYRVDPPQHLQMWHTGPDHPRTRKASRTQRARSLVSLETT